MGNLTLKKNRLGHETEYNYDELNRLIREEDSQAYITEYSYDPVGNQIYKKDPNGTKSSCEYYDNYLLKKLSLDNGEEAHDISYQYDETGFLKRVEDGGVVSTYNYLYNPETNSYSYTPDPYNRIYRKTDMLDGQSFSTEYAYDIMGRVSGIKSPRGEWVEYEYNTLGELQAVPGYVLDTSYNNRGILESVKTINGIVNNYNYDRNGRISNLNYENQGNLLKEYRLEYDNASNIVRKNDSEYNYDKLNQLLLANLKGKFENNPHEEEQLTFQEIDDYTGQERMENRVDKLDIVELDYAAGSIGVDLELRLPVSKIVLSPDNPVNRVKEKDLEIYESIDNLNYTKVEGWEYYKDKTGEVTLVFKEEVETRYIKIKSYFDERDEEFKPVNKAEFTNKAEDLIKVYLL